MKTHLAVHLLLLMLLISQTEGKTRKLLTATTPTTTAPNSKEETTTQGVSEAKATLKGKRSTSGQLGGGEENFAVNSSSAWDHYPDIMDIAGMDYTPAKRKPPIHN